MRVIFGLGNPGTKYANTRHNAGFLFLDTLAHHFKTSFQEEKKFQAHIAEVVDGKEKILLVKPNVFMNNSGQVIASIVHFYKISLSDVMIIHDDIDIASGTFKTTASSRSAGHNGVQDIIDALGSQDFYRVRLGVGRPNEVLGACIPSHEYVIAPFEKEELKKLEALFPEILEDVTRWLQHENAS